MYSEELKSPIARILAMQSPQQGKIKGGQKPSLIF